MNAYNITIISNESFDILVTICNSDSPLQYLADIENELKKCNLTGNVLIDQILHVGNNDERFLSFLFDEKGIRKDSLKFEKIPKQSVFRELSCNLLKDNQLIESSILSTIQKKMITSGIYI